MQDTERRLRALERAPVATRWASYDRLMTAASSGQLKESDLQRLTDEQLWWLVANEPEQRLREVASSGSRA